VLLYLYLDKVSNAFEWYYLLYIPILGLLMALSLINIGHELVHRTSKKFDCEVGNWALATAWNPAFAIEHVYGHHKNLLLKYDMPMSRMTSDMFDTENSKVVTGATRGAGNAHSFRNT